MEALALTLFVGLALLLAYHTYGRWVANRVFQLRDDAATPAVVYNDNCDYCPTKKGIVFGHHFTSIAGTGPIVGPAIAVMWGWVPAVIWVLVGSIFIGAVHDLGSLVVSLRSKGRSVGDIAGDLLGPRVRLIFLGVLVLALWVVLAIFGLVVAAVLRQYPQAIFPVIVQIPLAVVIGLVVHRKGHSIVIPSAIALALMYASVVWGDVGFLGQFNAALAAQPTWVWVTGLLVYSYIASVLPVWVLLQPRDYINSLQLITALGLIVVGLVGAATLGGVSDIPATDGAAGATERIPLEMVAPVVNWNPEGAPPMIPVLFITIACGAISGFHCLVSSGTTSKQLTKETDAKVVGYGSMLTEGFLATLVIVSCAAGIGLGVTKSFESLGFTTLPTSDERLVSHFNYETIPLADGDALHLMGIEEETTLPDVDSPQTTSTTLLTHQGPKGSLKHWGLRGSDPETAIGVTYDLGEGEEKIQTLADASPLGVFKSDDGTVRISDGPGEYSVTGALAFNKQYESWGAAGALGAKVGAFVDGSANLIKSIGIPAGVAVALMGVLVASFAGTTMDTACRLQRYVIQELARTFLPRPHPPINCRECGCNLRGLTFDAPCPGCGNENDWRRDLGGHPEEPDAPALEDDVIERHASVWNPFRWLATRHGATSLAVISAIALAFIPAPGQAWSFANAGAGGLILWPLFGATNQLLGGLAFVVIAVWLIASKKPWWFVVVPAALMLVLPAWAMAWQAYVGSDTNPSWVANGDWILAFVASVMLVMEAWLIVEVAVRAKQGRINSALLANSNFTGTVDDDSSPAC